MAISVVHLTVPSKIAMGAWTFMAEAVMSTVLLALIFTWPPAFMVISQPLLVLQARPPGARP